MRNSTIITIPENFKEHEGAMNCYQFTIPTFYHGYLLFISTSDVEKLGLKAGMRIKAVFTTTTRFFSQIEVIS